MKLRNQILRSFILLGLFPLLAAIYGMMVYSEHLYLRTVDNESISKTDHIGRLISDEILQRALLLDAISQAPHFLGLAVALETVTEEDQLTDDFAEHLKDVQELLASIQPMVAEDAVIRVLDDAGRTIIKVRFGSIARPTFETLLPYRIIENEPPAELVRKLDALPDNQTSHVLLPDTHLDFLPLPRLALLDAVRPISVGEKKIFLTYSSRGERLNRLLGLIPRFRDARISIGTRTPAQVLFDDNTNLPFGGFPKNTKPPPLFHYLSNDKLRDPNGVIVTPETRFYYTDFFPFHDHLVSWVITAEIDQERLLGFFKPLRWGVAIFSGLALLLALVLGITMSRRLADPVSRLATNMNHYARGEPTLPDVKTETLEIHQLQSAFSTMTQELEQVEADKAKAEKRLAQSERLASIGEMAAGIGHELNNPLNNILSLGKLMRQSAGDPEAVKEDLDDLMSEAKRATGIVSGVLRFARQVPPEYEAVDICLWLENCVSRVSNLSKHCEIHIEQHCQQGEQAEFDPHQMEQVVINLLTNAIQASKDDGTVTVSARIADDQLIIDIEDSGAGMSEDTLEHLFEPFYTTKGVGEGSGLGLSISVGIVESHNGTLSLTNREPHGVIATITIPCRT